MPSPLRFLCRLSLLCPATAAGVPQAQRRLPFLPFSVPSLSRPPHPHLHLPFPPTPRPVTTIRLVDLPTVYDTCSTGCSKAGDTQDIHPSGNSAHLSPASPQVGFPHSHPKERHQHPSSWVNQKLNGQPCRSSRSCSYPIYHQILLALPSKPVGNPFIVLYVYCHHSKSRPPTSLTWMTAIPLASSKML